MGRPVRRSILAALLAGACVSSSPPPAEELAAPPGQTGALAAVAVGGRLKLYVPEEGGSGNGRIKVLDGGRAISGASTPARIGTVDLGGSDFAGMVGGNARDLVAASVSQPVVWFIDPATDRVTGTFRLDASYGNSSFSGRTPFMTGLIVDGTRRRAYIGVYNGYAVVDLDQKKIVGNVITAPSESFGYDAARNRILSPFYNCTLVTAGPGGTLPPCDSYKTPGGTTIAHGLNLVDLASGTTYTYQDAAAADPAAPLGLEPDSASFAPASGLAIVAAEGPGIHQVLDLSKTVLDPANKSFTAPRREVSGVPLTGVAGTPDGSFIAAVQESTDLVAVYGRGATAPVRARLPAPPGLTAWESGADPHPLATATWNGRAVAFVASNDGAWVARIDLATLHGLTPAGAELTPAEAAVAVTLLGADAPAP